MNLSSLPCLLRSTYPNSGGEHVRFFNSAFQALEWLRLHGEPDRTWTIVYEIEYVQPTTGIWKVRGA